MISDLNMEKDQRQICIKQLTNNILPDLKHLSGVLKPVSSTLYENNNAILNSLLVASDYNPLKLISNVLSHCLQVSQHKVLNQTSLSIVSKIIVTVKSMKYSESQKADMIDILCNIIDSICLLNVQKSGEDFSLRIVQVMFSLIDVNLISYFGGNHLTKVYAVFFEQSKVNNLIKNISVSALFALTECLFGYGDMNESFSILECFLHNLMKGKKYSWIKISEIRGLIWDLVIVAIKNLTSNHLIQLDNKQQIKQQLSQMYDLSLDYIMNNKNKNFYQPSSQLQKNYKDAFNISDFIRYFKAYVAISTSLSIEAYRVVDKEYVKFRETIPKMIMICDLQRNSRMFIFLEALCQILLFQYDLPVSIDKGIVFIEILSKISEELCLCNESIKTTWENNQCYLDKIIYDEPKISDGDFVKLIKNTLFQLRLKYEKDEDLKKCKIDIKNSARIISDKMGTTKKWEIFIKHIIRTIRYLSSLNFVMNEYEEDPTRKIVTELQQWFLICPSYRAKNMILQELLVTSNQLTNKLQAIKVSQCVQIGSNIMYGYYEDLDSLGLTIILKMMAGVKADWQQGKSFEELDQIYNLAVNVFKQQNFFKTEAAFILTIQAIVQCANSLIADLEQPKQQIITTSATTTSKRQYKMIEFTIEKLLLVIENNLESANKQWNFITAFFITLCFNKNIRIKDKGIKQIGTLVNYFLKADMETYSDKKQQQIMELYLELSKSRIKQIELYMIEQLKAVMPRIKEQSALMDGFRIAKIFSESEQDNKQIISGIHELQQILIKECLFQIVDRKYLKLILDGLQIKFAEKNEEYRLINLFWNIADHFRSVMLQSQNPNDFLDLWENLFKSMWNMGQISKSSETKQSAIHIMTQILAEASSILSFDFILGMITKFYHPMVLLLVGLHPSSYIEPDKISETSKIALKNTIKIFKKLISGAKTPSQQEIIKKSLCAINSEISHQLKLKITHKEEGDVTVELLLELSYYTINIIEDKVFEEEKLRSNSKQLFQTIQEFISMCGQIENSKIQLNSHLYKKKLKPALEKLAKSFEQDIVAKDEEEK